MPTPISHIPSRQSTSSWRPYHIINVRLISTENVNRTCLAKGEQLSTDSFQRMNPEVFHSEWLLKHHLHVKEKKNMVIKRSYQCNYHNVNNLIIENGSMHVTTALFSDLFWNPFAVKCIKNNTVIIFRLVYLALIKGNNYAIYLYFVQFWKFATELLNQEFLGKHHGPWGYFRPNIPTLWHVISTMPSNIHRLINCSLT